MTTLELWHDDAAESPREWDNIGTLALAGRNLSHLSEGTPCEDFWELSRAEAEVELGKTGLFLPVYKYEHSGVAYNTTGFHCRRDSGQVGWIYAPLDDVRAAYGVKRISKKLRARVLAALAGEVAIFSQWANGDVYGFSILNEEGEVEDSCGGFYGADWDTNGIKDYLPEELHEGLENAEVHY